MDCHKCGKSKHIDDFYKKLTHTIFPKEYCSKCYLSLILAEGDCNKCNSTTTHRLNENSTIPYVTLQRMATIRAKFIPRIICGCGGIISLTRIANKDFLKKLHQSINLKNKMMGKLI